MSAEDRSLVRRLAEYPEHTSVVGGGFVVVASLAAVGVVDGLVGSTDGVDAPLCGLTRITRDGDDWRLAFSGDTSHLDD